MSCNVRYDSKTGSTTSCLRVIDRYVYYYRHKQLVNAAGIAIDKMIMNYGIGLPGWQHMI